MARLRNDSRRHRRRSLRRLLPLWLVVWLVGLGLALAVYQQQRRSAVETADAPRQAAEGPAIEAGADPAAPPDQTEPSPPEGAGADVAAKSATEPPVARPEPGESTEAEADIATTADRPPDEQPASRQDVGSTELPSGAETTPSPAVEGEHVATLDQQDGDRPGDASEPRTGPTAARPESGELSVSREPAQSAGGPPSSVADLPAPPSQRGQAATTAAPVDRPGPDAAPPVAGSPVPPRSPEPSETRQGEGAAPSRMAPAPELVPPSRPEPQIATAGPTGEAGARQRDEPGEASSAEPEVETESLVADTLRGALEALLGGRPDKLAQRPEPEPVEEELPEPQDKLAGQNPTAPQLAAVEPQAAKPELTAPSFDVVRVRRGGGAVIAGRAAPGAEVELRVGGEVIDRVRADQRGQWVSVPQQPLPAGDQELTVAARSGDALPTQSDQVVVLAVPGTEPTSGRTDHPTAAAVALEAPDDQALAVLLPKDGRGQGRVLQAPGRLDSDGQLALLMLDYDESGQIRLSGEATPGAVVRVYVDNALSAETVAGEDGTWTCELDRALAPGSYTLRVDQLDRGGKPVARLETPFTRVSQPPVQGDVLVDYVVVQPGNSLWRIARRLFGSGFEYVHIYEANQAQIRDPDLIYPGQVFEIPTAMGSAG